MTHYASEYKESNADPKPEVKGKKVKGKMARIKPMSESQKQRLKQYSIEGAKFLIDKICPITNRPAETIHHKMGRRGEMLLKKEYWLACTMEAHIQIENNPEWAYKNGYSLLKIANNEGK